MSFEMFVFLSWDVFRHSLVAATIRGSDYSALARGPVDLNLLSAECPSA